MMLANHPAEAESGDELWEAIMDASATAKNPAPTLRELRVRAVRVPMKEPHQTASGAVAESPLVLTDATFDNGVVGHSMVFTYTPMALKPVA